MSQHNESREAYEQRLPLRRRRTQKACMLCRKQKARCEGGFPCRRCLESEVQCKNLTSDTDGMPSTSAALTSDSPALAHEVRACFETLCATLAISVPTQILQILSEPDSHGITTQPDAGNKRLRFQTDAADQGERTETPAASSSSQSTYRRHELLAAAIFLESCIQIVGYVRAASTPDELLRTSAAESQLLYLAVLASGSRENEELRAFHGEVCQKVLAAAQSTLYERCTLGQFKGLLLYQQFLSEGNLVGHLVSQAYQLDLHMAGKRVRIGTPAALEDLDGLRLFGQLYIVDRLAAVATGSPHLLSDGGPIIEDLKLLTRSTHLQLSDLRVLMQAEAFHIVGSAVAPQAGSLAGLESQAAIQINKRLDEWHQRWVSWMADLGLDRNSPINLPGSIEINYYFARLYLCSSTVHRSWGIGDFAVQSAQAQAAVQAAEDLVRSTLDYFSPSVLKFATRYSGLVTTFAVIFGLKLIGSLPQYFLDAPMLELAPKAADMLLHSPIQAWPDGIRAALHATQQIITQARRGRSQAESATLVQTFVGDDDNVPNIISNPGQLFGTADSYAFREPSQASDQPTWAGWQNMASFGWDDFIAGSLSDVTQYNNGISYDPLLLPDVEALLGDGASTGGFAS